MNAESEFQYPYFHQQQSFFPLEQVQVHHPLHKSTARSNLVQTTVSAYNMGREGDLFKDLDPIMEEPVLELDPVTVVSMISSGEDITTQSTNVSDISSIQSGHLLSENSTSSEYYRGGESDLFKAPVSIMEESILGCDPMTLAISKISCGEDVISAEMIEAADIKSFQNECLLSELSNEWKELMEKSTMYESSSKALDIKIPAIMKEENLSVERYGSITGSPMQKSVSSRSLSSMEWIDGEAMRSNFVDFQTKDFGAALGITRAFSEGIIQTLGTVNTLGHSSLEQMPTVDSDTSEERKLMLSRYKIKKARRNFGRKIKYACRKALAENQPRVRGRFAKTEEAHMPTLQ
eukprot:TRINITY_DN9097_c0_g1_i1.p1 TRINITY_DN9097_c0_g1~~TRINITY_DN9097_c0_g1_i1.p1  ORF type:complete len:349 (-),score=81.30 TRINITY_DN9097_c0_g1_i1:274-1320(-)